MSLMSFDFKTGMYASIKGFSYDDIGSTPAWQVVNKFVINMRHVIFFTCTYHFPPKCYDMQSQVWELHTAHASSLVTFRNSVNLFSKLESKASYTNSFKTMRASKSYHIVEQRVLRRGCTNVQPHQSHRFSHTQFMDIDDDSCKILDL